MKRRLCIPVRESKFQTCRDVVMERIDDEEVTLRTSQKEALTQLSKFDFSEEKNNNTALIVLPTGVGKSVIAELAPFILGAKNVLIITPSSVISEQLEQDFTGNGQQSIFEKIKMIEKEELANFIDAPYVITKTAQLKSMNLKSLVIANAHKFGTNSSVEIEKIPNENVDLLIIDEAHHFPAATWQTIAEHFCSSKKVFLTATPFKGDTDILKNQKASTCFELTVSQAVEKGYIRQPTFNEYGSIDDRFENICELIGKQIITELQTHDALAPNVQHQAMILVRGVKEAKECVEYISSKFPTTKIGGYHGAEKTSEKNRTRFDNGSLTILVVCGKLLEGYDNKRVSVVAVLRRIDSRIMFTQFAGRAMRTIPNENGINARIISHVTYKQQANFDQLNEMKEGEQETDDDIQNEYGIQNEYCIQDSFQNGNNKRKNDDDSVYSVTKKNKN